MLGFLPQVVSACGSCIPIEYSQPESSSTDGLLGKDCSWKFEREDSKMIPDFILCGLAKVSESFLNKMLWR
ncbi:hypothetical protein Y1Q_0004450 [Alligator mississippiensis]|uniref:Uncharacterized protein n=1 Tax=Alligator mississippiensis TaxID=8496 RepID=A0A151NT60_ALLMI|nr:hypothetical protein Y1Q_0004450 [Alligator mississippiensis]